VKLRVELENSTEVRQALSAKLMQLTPLALQKSKGLFSCLFYRSPNFHEFSSDLSQLVLSCEKQWHELYPTHDLTAGLCGKHAYGEPNFLTIGRICHVISSELQRQRKPLKPGDILVDWGCGAGKWLCFARKFLGIPDMVALGIEEEQAISKFVKEIYLALSAATCYRQVVKPLPLFVQLA
jgi:hypothetical protein